MKSTGKVIGIVSNLVTVQTNGPVAENELCYINLGGTKLLASRSTATGRLYRCSRAPEDSRTETKSNSKAKCWR